MKRFLIVVDMQNDFIDGALGTPEARAIVERVRARIERAEAEGRRVLFTQDTHEADYSKTAEGRSLPIPHCIRGTAGWAIHPLLAPYTREVFEKPTFGSLALAEYLAAEAEGGGANLDIELCGVCTDICVVSNALLLRAKLSEAKFSVDADCCAGVTPESHEAALKVLAACQINIMHHEGEAKHG